MELFKIKSEILLENDENDENELKPIIELSLINEFLEIKKIRLSYAQLKFFIFQLEIAKEETQSRLAISMHKYIR